MKVHIVQGSSGEYEDHTEWPVAAYLSKRQAEKRKRLAQQAADKLLARENLYDLGQNPYDPDMNFCGGYIAYSVWSIETEDAPPKRAKAKE